MKPILCLILLALGGSTTTFARADDPREAKPRFKGVELYSWQDAQGGWVFVLLDGTNRAKTEKEIKAAAGQLKGVDRLKKALARLAVGEQVFWSLPSKAFKLPPADLRKAILDSAGAAKIEVQIVDR